MSLIETIKNLITISPESSISFYQFMELALYHPTYGYYCRNEEKVGKGGDFYTNASVGSVFGEILAGVFTEMGECIASENPIHLIEFGGGNGTLMKQVLSEWKHHYPNSMNQLKVVMIDRSSYHRSRQMQTLSDYDVIWAESLEEYSAAIEGSIQGIVFSNELIDAFPVHLVERRSGQWWEVCVGWDETANAFIERLRLLENKEILNFLQIEEASIPSMEGYRLEVNLDGVKWLENVAKRIQDGYIVTIDYGYERQELYISERCKGSIMCYKNHQAFENPLIGPGEMDITSHVNFSSLIEEGRKQGIDSLGLFSQSEFLINGGILDRLMEHQETDPFAGMMSKKNRAIRQLIMPGGMGSTFKVLVQAKGNCSRDLTKLQKRSWI
ncbi:MAG TPA: SAM-dependent methyltransferase [Bacillota bacterium]|nr:SAM-dependent methyltransferase [Bacillota bacterium]